MKKSKGRMRDNVLYRRADAPVEARVEDLLGRMTLEEKVCQMGAVFPTSWEDPKINRLLTRGRFSPRKAAALLSPGPGHMSMPLRYLPIRKSVDFANAIQKFLVEHTRLGIPAIIHDESLHGCMLPGSTSFPQAIGLAATWDDALMHRVAQAIGRETFVRGIRQCLSPTINIARDPRCGRTEESYGEDPWLTSRMGVAFVRGVQSQGVAATVKHFAANFVGDGGRDSHAIHFSERHLREVYFPAFEACVREAGAMSVMPAYNALDGQPCACNRWLLTDVLKKEWGFDGVTVSDYLAVEMIHTLHHVAESFAEAGRKAAEAGMDIELPEAKCFKDLAGLIRAGDMAVAPVDDAVRRVLRLKFRLGLFENPYANAAAAVRVVGCAEHRALALEAARRSLVLLKNEGGVLPLANARTIAVLGPNAAIGRLGNYSTLHASAVSPLEGMRRRAGQRIKILHAEGCEINGQSRDGFARAVEAARAADMAVLFMGNTTKTEGEGRDRCRLELPGVQEDLIRDVAALGKPTVVVLIGGGAVAMERWIERVPAVVAAWCPGMEGGHALAQVLFGDVNPGGKLPLTFPRTTGQLPLYYNMKPSSRGYDYVDQRGVQPMFPFGHGLSYTTFKYGHLKIEPRVIPPNGSVTVSVDVRNTGYRAGDEVVQLYLSDLCASLSRPVKELKRFKRVRLARGQKRVVRFTLEGRDLAFLDRHLEPVVEPGEFEVMVGGSSAEGVKARFSVKAGVSVKRERA
ncbi:MAG: glycoside hydrolase family 3 C-terminal domain-containing protein [Lentisphaerae bacterium]|nr:glycoside hydrolase family 3 C-terminal domain-containing protein [Lentisphaerota bacterium]